MYGKIYRSIYDGTLAANWEALVTFQQLIVLSDVEGVVEMTPDAISRTTGIPFEIITKGLAILERPDAESRTPTEEGRRIVRVSATRGWGWRIVNYKTYRELTNAAGRRAYHREYYHTHRKELVETQQFQQDSTPISTDFNSNSNKKKEKERKKKQKDISSATSAENAQATGNPPSTQTPGEATTPGKPRRSKATLEGAAADPPANWVAEGTAAWVKDIGFITRQQFGGQMKAVVDFYGWEKVRPWFMQYIRLRPYMVFGRFYGDDPRDYDKPPPTRNLHGVSLADFVKTITIWQGLCQPIEHPKPTASCPN